MGSVVKTIGSQTAAISNANYTITDSDGYVNILVTTGASQRTITLPAPSTNAGREITIKKVDSGAGTILIDTPGSETIDGNVSNTLNAQYSFVKLACDGSNWSVVAVNDYKTSISSTDFQTTTPSSIIVGDATITLNPGIWHVTVEFVLGIDTSSSNIGSYYVVHGMIRNTTTSSTNATSKAFIKIPVTNHNQAWAMVISNIISSNSDSNYTMAAQYTYGGGAADIGTKTVSIIGSSASSRIHARRVG